MYKNSGIHVGIAYRVGIKKIINISRIIGILYYVYNKRIFLSIESAYETISL